MPGNAALLRIALAAYALLVLPAATSDDEDPALCRDAIAARKGSELEALAAAEQERWHKARRVERETRKLMRGAMGHGESRHALESAARIDALQRRFAELVGEARVICGCRERRGDPYREDCETGYRRRLPRSSPPRGPEPEAPREGEIPI